MTIAESFEKRYYKLPEEWFRELWCGDEVDVCKTKHYGEPFYAFMADMKAVAVSYKIDEEYSIYKYTFADGSSAVLDDYRNSFHIYN